MSCSTELDGALLYQGPPTNSCSVTDESSPGPYILRSNINENKNTFILDGKEIGNVGKFPYLGSIVTEQGGSMEDVN
jgi:hypothetical protein